MGQESRDGRVVDVNQRPLAPIFRWAGGKRWLVPEILRRIPSSYGRYYEPFVGGGALFFALRPKLADLADLNPELVGCYKQLREDAAGVEARLRVLPHDSETYYRLRSSRPRTEHGRAARFIYLTTLAWNG